MYFPHYSCAIIILFNIGQYKSAFSTYSFGKLVVLSFCAFCVYFFCVELDAIFLNLYNICIIIVYMAGVKCFCSQLLVIQIRLYLLIKNHASRKLFLFFFSRKFKKWNIYFGTLILAGLKCYCGGNGHKMQSSFKTLVSKDAVTWRLHQTSG